MCVSIQKDVENIRFIFDSVSFFWYLKFNSLFLEFYYTQILNITFVLVDRQQKQKKNPQQQVKFENKNK